MLAYLSVQFLHCKAARTTKGHLKKEVCVEGFGYRLRNMECRSTGQRRTETRQLIQVISKHSRHLHCDEAYRALVD